MLHFVFMIMSFSQGPPTPYQLRGMICYYGKHYDVYLKNDKTNSWWVFDDATVKEVRETFHPCS